MEEEEGKAEGGIPNSGSSEQGGPWELRDPEGMLLADQDLVLLGEGWKVGHTHLCTHKRGTKGGARKMHQEDLLGRAWMVSP